MYKVKPITQTVIDKAEGRVSLIRNCMSCMSVRQQCCSMHVEGCGNDLSYTNVKGLKSQLQVHCTDRKQVAKPHRRLANNDTTSS